MADTETHDDYLEEVWALFAEEGKEALDLAEETLLELESDPTDAGQVAKLLRAMHTFKGEARMMGLSTIESLAHHAEDLVALVRDEGVALTGAMIDLLLEVLDHSRVMLDHALVYCRDTDAAQVEGLVARLETMLAERSEQALPFQKISTEGADESTDDLDETLVPSSALSPSASLGMNSAEGADEGFILITPEEIIDLTTDPEYVRIFLEMAEDELGCLRTALDALADGDEESIQEIEAVADTLMHAAGRMGYERLGAILDDLVTTLEEMDGETRVARLNELVLTLSEEVAAIQGEDVVWSLDSAETVQSLPSSKVGGTRPAERESDLVEINEADNIENMYLTFDIQDEEYAVNVAYVTEIVGLQGISKVPDVPKFIKGVINLRGRVIPVMDESRKLARYLEKTRGFYKYRVAYCIGDFRKAMEKALTMTDVAVAVVPRQETLEANVRPNKPFKFGSLSRRPYLQDLSDALTRLKGVPPRTVGVTEQSLNDTDWYLI